MQLLFAQVLESSAMSSSELYGLIGFAFLFLLHVYDQVSNRKSASTESQGWTDSGRQLMEPVPEFYLQPHQIHPDND